MNNKQLLKAFFTDAATPDMRSKDFLVQGANGNLSLTFTGRLPYSNIASNKTLAWSKENGTLVMPYLSQYHPLSELLSPHIEGCEMEIINQSFWSTAFNRLIKLLWNLDVDSNAQELIDAMIMDFNEVYAFLPEDEKEVLWKKLWDLPNIDTKLKEFSFKLDAIHEEAAARIVQRRLVAND